MPALQYEGSLENHKRAIQFYEQSGATTKISSGLCEVARVLAMQEQYENAIEHFQRALLTDSTKFLQRRLHFFIAVCYSILAAKEKSSVDKTKLFALSKTHWDVCEGFTSDSVPLHAFDQATMAHFDPNLSIVDTLAKFQKAINDSHATGSKPVEARSYMTYGEKLIEIGDHARAIESILRAERLFAEIRNNSNRDDLVVTMSDEYSAERCNTLLMSELCRILKLSKCDSF